MPHTLIAYKCNQIGVFLKVFDRKVSTKSSPKCMMSLETINILSKNCCGFFWISATFYVNVWSNCQPLCLRSRQFCKRPTTIRQQHQTIFRSKVNITRFILNVTYLDSIALYFPRFSDKTKLNVNKMKWDYITNSFQFFHIKSKFWNHLIIKDFYVQRLFRKQDKNWKNRLLFFHSKKVSLKKFSTFWWNFSHLLKLPSC